MGKLDDLTGKRFGRLVVLNREGTTDNRHTIWHCKCDCGNECTALATNLKRGLVKSCGCLKKEITRNRAMIHGMTGTRLHRIWKLMHRRCYNLSDPKYPQYGGRGIHICEEWKTDFLAFYYWSTTNGYADNLSIDRIDVNGPYSPDNCRWATNRIQSNNRTTNVILEYHGIVHTAEEWACITGIPGNTIRARIERGWSVEQAITIRPNYRNRVKRKKE